ncbi:glycine zipper domain-containing protein [Comamonadaceae bacterium G21597-S1]|nr:glycine zipper domain-containing protein [Comamonadaceae bacterium G21597-S1]
MKSIVLLSVAALSVATAAGAQEFGRVLSSTPVIGQVALPQQVCHDTTVVVPGQRTGAVAALGAVTGAVIGSTVGQGNGRVVGSVIGMVGGALIGEQLAGRDADHLEQVRQCTTHTTFENRVLHYDVVYEYAGQRYTARMPNDPGPMVQVQVTPVGVTPPPLAPPPMATMAPMQGVATMTRIHTATEYVPYVHPHAASVYLGPIVIGLPVPGWRHAPQQRLHPYHDGWPGPRHRPSGQNRRGHD